MDQYTDELPRVIGHLKNELSKRRAGKPIQIKESYITDHALIRYLERVKGIDLNAIREEILPAKRKSILKSGAGRIKGDGYELICADGAVVTVIK